MRVLVTGANGFVGNHLSRALIAAGHTVVATGGHGFSNIPEGTEFIELDLTDRAKVDSLDFTGVDGVVHLAGMAAVGPSFNAPQKYLDVNGGIEVNLFEAALRQNVKPRFVIVSSGTLYDPHATLPLTEVSAVRCNSPYAVSKRLQEELAGYYQSRGFECIIARPFNHIGPGQGEGFLLPDLAKQIAIEEKTPAGSISVGNLQAKRDYTDVRDIAKAYVALLEKGNSGSVYNICSGKSVSGQAILEGLLKRSTRKDLKTTIDKDRLRPADVADIFGDNSSIHSDTGWQPTISLDQTLADVLDDWRARITSK